MGYLVVLVVLLGFVADRGFGQFTRSVYMDRDKTFKLGWTINEVDRTITFQIEAKTLGWVGLALSRDGQMNNSDIVIGWKDKKTTFLKDAVGTGNMAWHLDEKQDWKAISWVKDNGYTRAEIQRRLCAGDGKQDIAIDGSATYVLFLYGRTMPSNNDFNSIIAGGYIWGMRLIYLMDPPQPDFNYGLQNLNTAELRMDNVKYDGVSLVMCRLFNLSEFANIASKHHIIKTEAVYNSSVPKRISLYQCYGVPSYAVTQGTCSATFMTVGGTGERTSQVLADYRERYCTELIASFGENSEAMVFPDAAGLSMGDVTDPKTFLLEVNYPRGGIKGTVDYSGIKLTYTSILRPNDAAILQIGSTPTKNMVIPPLSQGFVVEGHCTQTCFSQGFAGINFKGEQVLTAFAASVATHRTAQTIRLRHVRVDTMDVETQDNELPWVIADKRYNPKFQQWRPLANVKLQPSDRFIVECRYAADNNVKFGGLLNEDETCIGMLAYYPKIRLSRCMTSPERSGIVRITIMKPTKDQVYNDAEYYKAIMYGADWSFVGVRNRFQLLTLRNDAVVVCTNPKTGQYVLNRLVTAYEPIDKAYDDPNSAVCRPSEVFTRVVTVMVTPKKPSAGSTFRSFKDLIVIISVLLVIY